MYDKSDPRSALGEMPARPVPVAFADAYVGLVHDLPPQDNDGNGRSWYIRGQNFVVVYTEATPGARFGRTDQPDEYVALLPDRSTPVSATAGTQTETCEGYSLIVMPPGDSRIVLRNGGRLVRLFSSRSGDLAARCSNAESYAEAHPNLPPFRPWPAPKDGFKIRPYSLDVPDEPGRFGRIWRCTTLMVNYLPPQIGPRDITKLSPHHHDDFEQCSLALEGSFMHHMRWPWTVDSTIWRPDMHRLVGSPSVTVIPPPAIHTSRGTEPGANQLVDIFSPPRLDFSNTLGWVLNAGDYPLPG